MSRWLGFLTTQFPNSSRQSGVASWTTDWVYPRNVSLFIASVEWTAVAATNGTLYLEMNNGYAIPVDADHNRVLVLPAGTPGTYGAWPNVGVAKDNAEVFIKNPALAMRLGYTAIAGGGADQFRVTLSIRK